VGHDTIEPQMGRTAHRSHQIDEILGQDTLAAHAGIEFDMDADLTPLQSGQPGQLRHNRRIDHHRGQIGLDHGRQRLGNHSGQN